MALTLLGRYIQASAALGLLLLPHSERVLLGVQVVIGALQLSVIGAVVLWLCFGWVKNFVVEFKILIIGSKLGPGTLCCVWRH